MADIFLSYADHDNKAIRPLVKALEQEGWSMFWDREIPLGKTWRQVLDEELAAARSVVVVWTETSVNRRWVIEEAEEGRCSALPTGLRCGAGCGLRAPRASYERASRAREARCSKVSDVWINGKYRRRAPFDVSLKPGKYTISVGQGTPSRTREVRLRSGEEATEHFDLSR